MSRKSECSVTFVHSEEEEKYGKFHIYFNIRINIITLIVITLVVWQRMNTTTIPLRSAAMVLSRLWVLEIALCMLVCLK